MYCYLQYNRITILYVTGSMISVDMDKTVNDPQIWK